MKNYRNILIIKPGAIGDLLQMTPVFRALVSRFPGCVISVLVGSKASSSLFRNNPHVHDAIVYEKKGEHRRLSSFLRLWQDLRRARYDLVLNFQRSNLKTWLLAMAAFPCRVLVYHRSGRTDLHAVVNYLDTVAPLGISAASLALDMHPGTEDRSFADRMLSPLRGDKRPVIAFNPGASHPVNRWEVKQFAALGDLLFEKLRAHIVIVGGKEDETLATRLSGSMSSKPLDLAGKATLLQLGALLQSCDLLVTGDTGPMHVAAAVGTRVVALFGAADPGRTGPLGRGHRIIQAADVSCVPCRSRKCESRVYLECMKKITPEKVFSVIEDMLGKGV